MNERLLHTLTWNNIVPFPGRGFICNLDKPFFIQMNQPNRDSPRMCVSAIVDSRARYSMQLLRNLVLEKALHINQGMIEPRMKSVALCTQDGLSALLMRHQGFLGDFSDVTEQCLLYFSFLYPAASENCPKHLEPHIRTHAIFEPAELFDIAQKEEPMLFNEDNTGSNNYGVVWDDLRLGDLELRKSPGGGWHCIHLPTGEAVFRQFAYLLEAQLHTEALFIYLENHPLKQFVKNPVSVVDFFLLDNIPIEEYAGEDAEDDGFVSYDGDMAGMFETGEH